MAEVPVKSAAKPRTIDLWINGFTFSTNGCYLRVILTLPRCAYVA